jgi:flavorubredoxin
MSVTNAQAGTAIDEIADGIYRIHTPDRSMPGGFSFNQILVRDEEPLLFHLGPRRMFPLVREAIETVLPIAELRWLAFSHFEADECGALNQLLAVAPRAQAVCSTVAKMVSVDDYADRPARALSDGETLSIGKHALSWLDAPHLPHGWETGYLFDATTRTLLCGDLFTQGGADTRALVDSDILGPSEAFRKGMDYHAHPANTRALVEKLAATEPTTLACMHGSSWRGDGAKLLCALGDALQAR